MVQVQCEVSAGLRSTEATVAIADVHNHQQCLRVERDFLTTLKGQWFLPVGVVYDEPAKPWVLIELPHEADSGANRLWVWREHLLLGNGAEHDPV